MADEQKPEQTPPVAKPPAAKPAAPKAPAVMASTPWEGEIPALLREQFGDRILETATYLGQNFTVVKPDAAIEVIEHLKLECDFDYLVDVTATHWPDKPEKFEIIYILYSFSRNERVRVKIRIQEGYKPESATHVHLAANWMEREVYDMFGVEFANHPDMKRLLMPEDWVGYPLRKDYGITQMDTQWVENNLGIGSGQ